MNYLLVLALIAHAMDGNASYYSHDFAGRRTASGEIFDPYALTAAHRTLPFGTCVRVFRIDNGDSILVRINDRGPYIAGRIIDLSLFAAEELGMIARGTARVRIEKVEMPCEMSAREAGKIVRIRGEIPSGADSISVKHAVLPIGYEGLCEYVIDAVTGETRVVPFTVVGRVRIAPRELVIDERSRKRLAISVRAAMPGAFTAPAAWPAAEVVAETALGSSNATISTASPPATFAWPPGIPAVTGEWSEATSGEISREEVGEDAQTDESGSDPAATR